MIMSAMDLTTIKSKCIYLLVLHLMYMWCFVTACNEYIKYINWCIQIFRFFGAGCVMKTGSRMARKQESFWVPGYGLNWAHWARKYCSALGAFIGFSGPSRRGGWKF